MDFYTLNTVFENTDKYCYHAKENDFMEVTEWKNGEGHDIIISSRNLEQKFSLTDGEFELLNVLINVKFDTMSTN